LRDATEADELIITHDHAGRAGWPVSHSRPAGA